MVIDGADVSLPPAQRRPHTGKSLERAFDQIADTWFELGKEMAREPSARYAHTPACAPNVSDFGLMLAWTKLIDSWSTEPAKILVVCEDPWVFRHLAARPGVEAGAIPGRWIGEIKLAVRGYAARAKAAFRVAGAAVRLAGTQMSVQPKRPALMVYGHPRSTPRGLDGYFGDLMMQTHDLVRVLHVDCPAPRAEELSADGRTLSLHAWGHPLFAITLPVRKWRPTVSNKLRPYRWLLRRASVREGGSGQAAMIAWQRHCQTRWLQATEPSVVLWPWENHSWERCFVRSARQNKIATVGYQHSVIGPQMLNYSPATNVDGLESVPDKVLCTGPATYRKLAEWGVPEARMSVGGTFRVPESSDVVFRADAPVFVALPFDSRVAAEMVAAISRLSDRQFLVKPHPMTPYEFQPAPNVELTTKPLTDHKAVSAVFYAATTVGLEAAVFGLPTLRFRPSDRVALDIMPAGISVSATDGDGLAEALANLKKTDLVPREDVFTKVDVGLWQQALTGDCRENAERSEI